MPGGTSILGGRGGSPCIMCVQYIGDVQYIGGCSVHRGDIMSTLGDIMSTSGDVQYIGGYHDECWGIP